MSVFIIIEAGVNNNRNHQLAFQLLVIDVSAEANAIKSQAFEDEIWLLKMFPKRIINYKGLIIEDHNSLYCCNGQNYHTTIIMIWVAYLKHSFWLELLMAHS